jgi:hypothetical protein
MGDRKDEPIMGALPLPDLPEIVVQLVRAGVYSVYTVAGDAHAPYILATDAGRIHLLSPTGRLLSSPVDKRLTDFQICAVVNVAHGGLAGPSIRINNT